MKLILVTNDGELLHEIEDIDEYNLSKSVAQGIVCGEIQQYIQHAKAQGKE